MQLVQSSQVADLGLGGGGGEGQQVRHVCPCKPVIRSLSPSVIPREQSPPPPGALSMVQMRTSIDGVTTTGLSRLLRSVLDLSYSAVSVRWRPAGKLSPRQPHSSHVFHGIMKAVWTQRREELFQTRPAKNWVSHGNGGRAMQFGSALFPDEGGQLKSESQDVKADIRTW